MPAANNAGWFFGFPCTQCCCVPRVYAWGAGGTYQLANCGAFSRNAPPTPENPRNYTSLDDASASTPPRVVERQKRWVVLTGGYYDFAGIDADGKLWNCGGNYYGELGRGNDDALMELSPLGDDRYSYCSMGWEHFLAIRSSGLLFACGRNASGEVGDGTTTQRNTLTQIGSSKWATVSAGRSGSLGIQEDGTLWSWGRMFVGDGTTNSQSSPKKIYGFVDSVSLSSSGSGYTDSPIVTASAPPAGGVVAEFRAEVTGGSVTKLDIIQAGHGYTSAPTLTFTGGGIQNQITHATATAAIFSGTWQQVCRGYARNAALTDDGRLYAWGSPLLDWPYYNSWFAPVRVGTKSWSHIAMPIYESGVVAGSFLAAIDTSGKLYRHPVVGTQFELLSNDTFTDCAAGREQTLAIKDDGTLWAMGANLNGSPGLGTFTGQQTTLAQVGSHKWLAVAAGPSSSYAIKDEA